MCSTRTDRLACPLALVVVLAALILVGCGSSARGGTVPGSALSPEGPQSGSFLNFGTPHAGSVYYVSFPMLTNRISQPVTVTGFAVSRTSGNVRVLGYVVHSTAQFGGRLVLAYDPTRPETSFDFAASPSLPLPYVIAAHGHSHRYAMARVRVTAYPPVANVEGCSVYYHVGSGSQTYEQTFDCVYRIGKIIPKLVSRPKSVNIKNSSGGKITIVNCPVCEGGRAVLPADPAAEFGWDLGKSDPVTADVIVAGRRVHCSPPARTPPDLVYDITRDGRCVALPG